MAYPPPLPPPGPAGKSLLYLPHHLFAGTPNSFNVNDSPVPPLPNQLHSLLPMFPLPPPQGLWVPNAGLRLHLLKKAHHRNRTTSRAQTSVSAQVKSLQQSNNRLSDIKVGIHFLANLRRYANPPVHGGQGVQANTTWTLPDLERIPIARIPQQVEGVKAVASWYLGHINRGPVIPMVNGEISVQDEVRIQCLELMNGLLKTRFSPLDSSIYPHWGRPIPALHRTAGRLSNAGFPDFLLIRSSQINPRDHGAIAEVKTPWSYTTDDFMGLSTDVQTMFQGKLRHNTRTTMGKLLLQIWGELHNFGCNLGFCTNGEIILFFAKWGQNTIVLSELLSWHHPSVHETLAGLCFAAVDTRHAGRRVIEDIVGPVKNQIGPWPKV